MIENIVFIIGAPVCYLGLLFFRTSNRKENIVCRMMLTLIILMSYQTVCGHFMRMLHIPVGNLTIGIADILLGISLSGYGYVKKRGTQTYHFHGIDVLVLVLLALVALMCGMWQFGVRLDDWNYISITDSVRHMWYARNIANRGVITTEIPFMAINMGMIWEIAYSFMPKYEDYRLFMALDVVLLWEAMAMFYVLIRRMLMTKWRLLVGVVFTILFGTAYPWDNMVYGTCYLGMSIVVSMAAIMLVRMYDEKQSKTYMVMSIFFVFFALWDCYPLFCPIMCVFLGVWELGRKWADSRCEDNQESLENCDIYKTVQYGSGKLPESDGDICKQSAVALPATVTAGKAHRHDDWKQRFRILAARNRSVSTIVFAVFMIIIFELVFKLIPNRGYLAIGASNYKNLLGDFVLLMPIALYRIIIAIRENKWEHDVTLIILMWAYKVAFAILLMRRLVSPYYYFKLSHLEWMVTIYLVIVTIVDVIPRRCGIGKREIITMLASVASVAVFVAVIYGSGLLATVQKVARSGVERYKNPDNGGLALFEVYEWNYVSHFRRQDDKLYLGNRDLFLECAKLTEGTDDLVLYAGEMPYREYNFYGLAYQPEYPMELYRGAGTEQMLEDISRFRYVCRINGEELPWDIDEYLDGLEVVYSDYVGSILLVGGN